MEKINLGPSLERELEGNVITVMNKDTSNVIVHKGKWCLKRKMSQRQVGVLCRKARMRQKVMMFLQSLFQVLKMARFLIQELHII